MCQSRIRFKRTLRECRQNEEIIRANEHAKSLMEKDMTLFWKGIKKNYNSKVPLAPMINNCVGEKDICDMWQAHYKDLLKGECSIFKKKFIMDENDTLSEYNEIPLGYNRTNGAVYSKIYFNVEICSAH